MKVLLVSSGSGSRGGGELFLPRLAEALSYERTEISAWIPSHPRMDELIRQFGSQVEILRGNYPNTYYERPFRSIFSAHDRKLIHRLSAEWKRLLPDVIHLNQQTPEDALDMVRAAKESGIPVLSTIHITQSAASLKARFGRFRDLAVKRVFQRDHSTIVAVSDIRAEELHAFCGIQPKVIYNGIPDASQAQPKGDFVMLGVGRLEPQKNPLRFLEIAAQIAATHPALQILWVGDGSMAEAFREKARLLGLTNRLTLPGWVSDVTPYFTRSAFYVHTAEFEGLPFSILEALRAGLPCFVSRSIIREAAPLAECCVPLDEVDWKAPFLEGQRLGEKSRRIWEQYFRADAMAQAYLKVYQSLCSREKS